MRRIRYQVAMSLDGFIAGPAGEYDWIVPDEDIDFGALYAQFDTFLMGRKTYQELKDSFLKSEVFEDKQILVFSDSLTAGDHPEVRLVGSAAVDVTIAELRSQPGKDIWLYGGGELFRSLLERGHVDTVEPAVIPVLLGQGRRFLPETGSLTGLELTGHALYPKSGTMILEYRVAGAVRSEVEFDQSHLVD